MDGMEGFMFARLIGKIYRMESLIQQRFSLASDAETKGALPIRMWNHTNG